MDRFEGLSARDLRALKRNAVRDLAAEKAKLEKWRRRHERVAKFLEITKELFAQRRVSLETTRGIKELETTEEESSSDMWSSSEDSSE